MVGPGFGALGKRFSTLGSTWSLFDEDTVTRNRGQYYFCVFYFGGGSSSSIHNASVYPGLSWFLV